MPSHYNGNNNGIRTNLYTSGGEYTCNTNNYLGCGEGTGGTYMGPMHYHPDRGYMAGAKHSEESHPILERVNSNGRNNMPYHNGNNNRQTRQRMSSRGSRGTQRHGRQSTPITRRPMRNNPPSRGRQNGTRVSRPVGRVNPNRNRGTGGRRRGIVGTPGTPPPPSYWPIHGDGTGPMPDPGPTTPDEGRRPGGRRQVGRRNAPGVYGNANISDVVPDFDHDQYVNRATGGARRGRGAVTRRRTSNVGSGVGWYYEDGTPYNGPVVKEGGMGMTVGSAGVVTGDSKPVFLGGLGDQSVIHNAAWKDAPNSDGGTELWNWMKEQLK